MTFRALGLFFFFLLFTTIVSAQKTNWVHHELDSSVSFQVPRNGILNEEINDTSDALGAYYEHFFEMEDGSIFHLQRTEIPSESLKANPNDEKMLKLFYTSTAQGLQFDFEYLDMKKKMHHKRGKLGCTVSLIDNELGEAIVIDLLVHNNFLYLFTYMDEENFSNKTRTIFLENISFNDLIEEPSSDAKKSKGKDLGFLMGQLTFYILALVGLIFLIRFIKNRA